MRAELDQKGRVQLVPGGVLAILLVGWVLFTYGYLWQGYLSGSLALPNLLILGVSPALVTWLGVGLWRKRDRWSGLHRLLGDHTDNVDAIDQSKVGLWIALAAGLGLYLELMIIRVHGSYFQLFAYFKNVSLLSCFLGLGIGYILGARRPLATPLVLPFVALQIILMGALRSSGFGTP